MKTRFINKWRTFKTRSPFFLAFSLASLVNCNHPKTSSTKDLQGVVVTEMLPLMFADGTSQPFKRDIRVFSMGDVSVFEIPYTSEIATEDTSIVTGKHFDFFVIQDNDSLGLIFDSQNLQIGKPAKKDSIFKKLSFTQLNPFKSKIDDGTLILKDSQAKNSHSQYLYVPREIKDASYPDSVIFYHDKSLNNYAFSLIRGFDLLKKAKLYQIRFVTNRRVDPKTNMTFGAKEMSFKFEVLKSFDREEILKVISSYMKVKKKN